MNCARVKAAARGMVGAELFWHVLLHDASEAYIADIYPAGVNLILTNYLDHRGTDHGCPFMITWNWRISDTRKRKSFC